MTERLGIAVLLGLGLGLGLGTALEGGRWRRRQRLVDRVAPFVLDLSAAARAHIARRRTDPLPVIGALLAPIVEPMRGLIASVAGGAEETRARLRRAGIAADLEAYRTVQARWMLGGAVGGAALSLMVQASGRAGAAVAFAVCGGILGAVAREQLLRARETARMRRIAEEFPTMLEFLTLAISAGEGIHAALVRVSSRQRGELAGELRSVVVRAGAGVPLARALEDLAALLRFEPLARTVEHLVAALERGAPLVDVLRHQARDARAQAKRSQLEAASRREIAMMVPLVLLVLPVTVLFAVYPSFFVIRTSF